MRRRPFYEAQKLNPFLKPTWRWNRAHSLVNNGRYYSRKRDDAPTGICVSYIRDLAKCRSDLRLRRVHDRFQHVRRAQLIWEGFDPGRLEIEARILARQNPVEIALAMDLPAAATQAYGDLFFDISDRINATSFILFSVLGLNPRHLPHTTALMKSSTYFHGAALIEPWLQYLREAPDETDLTTEFGRTMASLDLFVAARTLPDDDATRKTLVKLVPILHKNRFNSAKSISAARAFATSTSQIVTKLDLPGAELDSLAYAPPARIPVTRKQRTLRWRDRQAA